MVLALGPRDLDQGIGRDARGVDEHVLGDGNIVIQRNLLDHFTGAFSIQASRSLSSARARASTPSHQAREHLVEHVDLLVAQPLAAAGGVEPPITASNSRPESAWD
jgi:hypothetical protein